MTRELTTCKSCHAPIFFAQTSKGEFMPIDAEPAENGNVLVTGPDTCPVAAVVNRGQASGLRAAGYPLYLPHFVTCPFADKYRRTAKETQR